MRKLLATLSVVMCLGLLPLASCGHAPTPTAAAVVPTDSPVPTATATPQPTTASASLPDQGPQTADATPPCPSARGEGTTPPAISIYSIVFVVNGLEQEVRGGDSLPGKPGDQVRVKNVALCVRTLSGEGGEACADFVALDLEGREIAAEHRGTHTVRLAPGFTVLPGPEQSWVIGENWGGILAVVNHWPPNGTDDPACGGGHCEVDDRFVVGFR